MDTDQRNEEQIQLLENHLRDLELKESRPAQVPQFKKKLFYKTESKFSACGQEQGTSEFNGSFTPMVANVNFVKTEQTANDYKLFLKNLPRFNRKSNVNDFTTCFENCMSGAPDTVKASYLLNCLYLEAVDLIMPSLPN